MSEKNIYDDDNDKEMAELENIVPEPHPGDDGPQDNVEDSDGE